MTWGASISIIINFVISLFIMYLIYKGAIRLLKWFVDHH